ncbi:DUF488 domain-containing protein [Desulfobacca acetoxidans]|uniref:DUF488 domain-containing protein n=1 Tax=Desulfobacca acetoxidans (strain ATCC 700848 / DSM 11109 / ASRB2) TaxID=880072 RepID=F2NCX3_DESAR|nr:DUF488 family protein [Desulfobacca acetoxidans]AEB09547.1 protein of unknown function DUF488 [Desulfobacca acetoxidans DSM 11109]
MAIQLKRVYEPPEETDGERLLVDRLWPRGVRKDAVRLSGWLKDLAPSDELRRWFAHDCSRWLVFQERYRAELGAADKALLVQELARKARNQQITLLYAAHDQNRNNAVVLKEVVEEVIQPGG